MADFTDKTWAELKTILVSNSLYYDYEDVWDPDTSPAVGYRRVISQRNAYTIYKADMPIIDDQDAAYGTGDYVDQKDFDDNYLAGAGERTYLMRSFTQTAAAGVTTDLDMKMTDEYSADITAFVFDGAVYTDSNAVWGDSLSVTMVDVDNVLGYGAGTVLGALILGKHIVAGAQSHFINPPSIDFKKSVKKIPQGVYLRVSYTSTGVAAVGFAVDIEYEY